MKTSLQNAKWLWLTQDKDITHQYICFRKKIKINTPDAGKLFIAADTDFIVWINGQEIGRGQFPDYPQQKSYSIFEVNNLHAGENIICVMVYYCGENFSTYAPGRAGMIASLETCGTTINTDGSWCCIQHPAFQSGGLPKLSAQLGFVIKYDARNELSWLENNFDDSSWHLAEIRGGATDNFWKKLLPRPVPPLKFGERVAVEITMQGMLFREKERETFADSVDSDMLVNNNAGRIAESLENEIENFVFSPLSGHANGYFIVVDLGRENVGLIDIELTASSGTLIDISHGEHLLDGRVRNKIGERNFTDRYICKEGLNSWQMPFRRIGGRYIQLNINSITGPILTKYIGITPTIRELPPQAYFKCGNQLTERTWNIGVRTLELCMQEHYEDSPWREQALYAYDSRNQALYAYYVWGNYDFAAASLDLLGKGIREDGLLNLCAPTHREMTIPIFSFVWVSELNEHWLHSGSDKLFKKYDSQIEFMIKKILELHDPDTNLYRLPNNPELWHFYEWVPGLSNEDCSPEGFHAAYNLYFYEMLNSYAEMLTWDGQDARAEKYVSAKAKLAEAINEQFWDNLHKYYATNLLLKERKGLHEHIQFLALYNKIVEPANIPALLGEIYSNQLDESSLSSMLYLCQSMMKIDPASRKYVSSMLSKTFNKMIFAGATSFWETKTGANDFKGAGSLCHAWSSIPLYYYHAYVLGVRPLEPGFKTFQVSPYPDHYHQVQGSVPTPSGFITVKWERRTQGIEIIMKGPKELSPVIIPLEEHPVIYARYNKNIIIPGE